VCPECGRTLAPPRVRAARTPPVVGPAAPSPAALSADGAPRSAPSAEERRPRLVLSPPPEADEWLPPAYDQPAPQAQEIAAAAATAVTSLGAGPLPALPTLDAPRPSDLQELLERQAAQRLQERLRLEKTLILLAGGLAVLLAAMGLLLWF
jgi:hypothetical protein